MTEYVVLTEEWYFHDDGSATCVTKAGGDVLIDRRFKQAPFVFLGCERPISRKEVTRVPLAFVEEMKRKRP